MFDDPEIDKLIIFALIGMVAVLGIAVIVLAVKRNTYYVDDNGNEIEPVSREKALHSQSQRRPVRQEPVEEEPVAATTVHTPITLKNSDELLESVHRETPISVKPTSPKGIRVTVTINGQSMSQTIKALPCLIGRDSTSCELAISEPAVSRRHARFFLENGILYIEDVSEHNGTFVNGTKLPPLGRSRVSEGDIINLGRAEITVDKVAY